MTLAVILLLFVGGGLIWKLQSFSSGTNSDAGIAKPDHFFALSKKVWRPTPNRPRKRKHKKGSTSRKALPLRQKPARPEGMVLIDAGWFVQGQGKAHHKSLSYRIGENNQLQWMKNDHPQRRVYLPSFWLDKREVRAGEYEICVQAGHCRPIYVPRRYFKPRPRKRKVSVSSTLAAELPMMFVSYKHARRYCQWLKKRLPSEAEWEKAARGKNGRLYPWGQQAPTCSNASTKQCPSTQKGKQASPVLRGKTPLGIFDLAGNVWEWTEDCYSTKGYQNTNSHNPIVRKKRCRRGVIRGGSFLLPASSPGLRTYYRRPIRRWKRLKDVGFRCARSVSL
jgi:formylglycine-generating enzyme required for sulfatase activity